MTRERLVLRPPAELIIFARGLRKQDIPAEELMWWRDRRLDGFKFRRQHPVAPYVLDFYCARMRLAIELDGSQHAESRERDSRRDAFLAARGIRVLRFWNEELFRECEGALEAIWEALHDAPPSSAASRHLLPEGRR